MISQETIDNVKNRMNLAEVVQDFLKLKKHGTNLVGLCPFHNEKTPSFTISPAKQIYKCFGCGKSGDSIQFLIEHEQLSYVGAIEWLAKKYNVQVELEGKKEYVKPVARLEKLDKKKLEWFEQERKISNNTLLRMKVTEAREFMPQLGGEAPVICFNYYRDDELVNIKFRGPKKSFRLSKDAELIFYNLDAIKGEEEAIIVECEMDVLTMVECGVYNAVGVPNGTAKGNLQLQYLDNSWESFEKLKRVIICVDDDEVGRLLKEELGRRIGKEKCKVVVYPEGCKDANEVLCKNGKDAVIELIQFARDWPIEGIIPMDDMFEEILDYYDNGYPLGAKAGFQGFDPLLSFYPGHLTMMTGIPGHGKDEVANELMVGLSTNENWKWGVFNFEEPASIHATKLIEKFKKKAFAFRKNPDDRISRRDFEHGISLVENHFHFVNISKVDVTMQGIIKKAIQLVKRHGIKGIIINPWNYLEHKRNGGQSETEYISEMLTMLCNFLWKYGVHCFLVAHPYKMQKDKKTGKYEVPTLYSINGSAHFYNKTHNGLCVYRNFDSGITDIYVQKVKWYWLGHVGYASYNFNVNTRQYSHFDSSHKSDPPEGLPGGNWKKVTAPELTNFYEPRENTSNNNTEEQEDLPF
ncbi:MAG TPA: CHC2 zinc finger domain-containing protein [Chitinophagaceae bacterium]